MILHKLLSKKLIKSPKKVPKLVWVGLGFIFLVILFVAYLYQFYKPTINLDHYVVLSYLDDGSADLSVDWDSIEDKYGSKVTYTDAARTDLSSIVDWYSPVEFLSDDASVMVDSVDSETNTYGYTWIIYNEEIQNYLNCNLKYDTYGTISDSSNSFVFEPINTLAVALWHLSLSSLILFFAFLLLLYYLICF